MIETRSTPSRRRLARLAATAALLPALLVTAAPVAAETTPSPSASPAPATAAPGAPTVARSTIGGPRMAETGIVTAPGAPAVPATSAAAWIVADAESGEVLAAKNPHGLYRPASTLKTLLAVTMAPRLDPQSTYTADYEDTAQEGTRVGMVQDQAYTLDDLWYGLLLRSGNDAATGIAKAGGGTLEEGVAMMQAEARRLQALDTTVVNPSGLDEDGQFASAYDLALWGRAALERRDLRHYISSVRHMFPGNQTATATKATSKPFWVYTENRLLLQGFEGAMGVKMGYTTKAQNTMIAAAERDGRTIVASLMFVPQGQITAEAGRLLEYGFATAGVIDPVGDLVDPISAATVSEHDDGFVASSVNRGPAVDGAGATDGSLNAVPVARSESLRWSAVAGSALVAVLLFAAASRVISSRRRYRRAGAYRF